MPNEYSDLIAEDKTSDLRQSVYVGARQQPDVEAKFQALSKRTGVPLEAVRLKAPEVELHDRLESFDYEKAIKESPKLSAWMADPKNSGVAHDDFDNLTGLEKTLNFGSNFGRAVAASVPRANAGLWGIGRAVGDVLPDVVGDPIANFAARYQKGATETAKFVRGDQKGAGFVEKSIYSGAESLGQNLLMLPASILTGSPAPMLATMGATTGGEAYGQARDKGVSVPGSLAFGASQAAIEVATESIPAIKLLRDAGLKTGFGRMLKNQMLAEIPSEQAATVLQDMNEWAVLNQDKPFSAYLAERPSAAAQTLIATMVGTGGQVSVTQGLQRVIGGDVQAQNEAFFKALADGSKNSKLRERLPDRFKELVAKYTEDGPVQNVFIPADKFAEYFQSVQIDPIQAAEEAGAMNFQEALASGGDVVIPMADFATHIAPTDHLGGLMQDLRLRQDELTGREAKLAEANRDQTDKELAAEIEKINKGVGADSKLDQAIQRIVTDVEGQLSTRYDTNTARQMATVMRGMAVLATRANPSADPVEAAQALWQKYGLNIRANPLPDVLTKAPNFDAAIDPMLDRLRTGDIPKQADIFGKSLVEWLRENGGLQDGGGELARMDTELWDKENRKGGQRRLVNQDGMTFDAARELAAQMGYQVGETERDFIDALAAEIGGAPVYKMGGENAQMQSIADTLDQLSKALSEMGVDLTQMDNAAVKKLLIGGGDDLVFDQKVLADLSETVFHPQSLDDKKQGYANRFKNPVTLKDGTRLSGFTDPLRQTTFHGFDRNENLITIRREYVNPDDIVSSRDSNRTADKLRNALRGLSELNQSLPLTIEIDGIQRSTVNSNGKQIAQTEEGIRNFWKWFGDSKVVDAEGRPLVVYHGTKKDFSEFKGGRDGMFTDDKLAANDYAYGDGGNVMPVYLRIENPSPWDIAEGVGFDKAKIKDAGYDGAILTSGLDKEMADILGVEPEPTRITASLVVAPAQIKSATGNNGQFDPANASILFQSVDQTNTDAFSKWFSDSKVVDTEGNPIIMYHGTVDSIDAFIPNSLGLIFTTPDRDLANKFSMRGMGTESSMYDASMESDGLSPNVIPVFVSSKKPFRFDSRTDVDAVLQKLEVSEDSDGIVIDADRLSSGQWELLEDPAIIDAIKLAGFDGMYVMEDGIKNLAVFDPVQIKSAIGNNGEFSETDPNILRQDKRGSIQFGADRKFQINLFEKADLSTFLHESGHFYLEVMGDLASDPNADQSVKDDYAKILKFLGVSNRDEIAVEHHEKFARANEAYLFEGNAPAPELRGVFQRFRAWLKVIYRQLQNLNVELSDEVRGVFDRIYATDNEIEQASREANIAHLFSDAKSAGMTDAEFSAYSDRVADTTAEAKETLQTKLMRVEKLKREAWWREQRSAVANEVAREFDDTPAAQAFDVLTAAGSDLKLNRAALTERYGEQILKQLPRGYGDGRGAVYTDNGADLDSVAEVSGFESADAMISALVNMPNRKRFIAAESDRRMMETHGDLLNDIALADEAMMALHNEKREQVLRIELRALNKQIKGDQVPPESLRAMAAGIIGQKQVRDINPHAYLLAEQKAARAAFKEMAEGGNRLEAFKQKQKELLNHYLYREATRAREESDAILKYMKTFETASVRGKLGKAGDQYLSQIDGILERYEFTRVTNRDLNRRDSLSAWLAEQEAQGNAVNVPESVIDDARRVNYRTVPIDELRAIRDAVKNIAHLANLKTKLVRKGKLVEFQDVVAELLAAVDSAALNSTGEYGKPNTKSDGILTKAAGAWRKFDAAHMKVEQVVEWLDGGKINGPWARFFFDLADDAQTQEYDLHRLVTQQIEKLSGSLDKKTLFDRTTVSLPGFNQPMTRYDLISIAMNMGNAQNMQRLMDGYGWTQADIQRVRDGLSLSDWRFVQGVWDAIDQLWAPMAALEKRASGLEPERVIPVEFEANGEAFRGGYFPLVYDPRRSNAGEKQADEAESVQNFVAQGYGRAATNKGATKKRAEQFSAPVLLDYENVITSHTAKVIKDISHREAVIGLNKILTQGQIKEALIDKLGEAQYTEFRKWMQVLVNDRSDSLANATGGAAWMMKFRTNTAIVTMGFKISTMLAQIAGIGPTLDTVRPRDFAKALTQFVKSPRQTWEFVTSKSGEMRNRSNTIERDVRDSLLRMRGEGGMLADVRRHAFILTSMADRTVSAPTWLAGYNGALADGLQEEDAIRAGDRAVRLSQGAGGSKDLAAVQRNNELMKLLTMYYTPFSVLYARMRDVGHQVQDQGVGYLPAAAARLIALVILPAVMGDLLAGRGPDDDEDETWWAIRKVLLYPVATLPVIRDFAGYMEAGIINASGEGQMKFPPSYKLSPIVGAIEKTIRTGGNILGGSDTKSNSEIAWDAFEVSGYMFGLPTAQPRITVEYLADLINGDADPENAPQLLHDALFRRQKDK